MNEACSVTTALRHTAQTLFQTGVASADPYQAVRRCLYSTPPQLAIALDDTMQQWRHGSWSRIHVVAIGKAAGAMARAAREVLPTAQVVPPLRVIVPHGYDVELAGVRIWKAGHPFPDAAGLAATEALLNDVQQLEAGDLLLVLLSGGGSALLPAPVAGISLDDKIAVTQALIACGADIGEINTVRKHLSRVKGGGLARLAAHADLHTLALSDVIGDDPSAIASGPTVPDPTTYHDALAVVMRYGLATRLPQAVMAHLQRGVQGLVAETPKPGDALFQRAGFTLIGSNAQSVAAVAQAAQQQGYAVVTHPAPLIGEARGAARHLANWARQCWQECSATSQRPLALLAGGETTVTLRGNGRGGRNQEFALAFALAARDSLPDDVAWVLLSGGTDGRDGPTDAAGACVDGQTVTRCMRAGIDPLSALANNDSYTALNASGDLLLTGPTGTNVADLQIVLLKSRSQ